MKRPSISNILAVLAAFWLGASCFGCTIVAAPPVVSPVMSCVLLSKGEGVDSMLVGIYNPPCDRQADSVFYWRIKLAPRCALFGVFDPNSGEAKLAPLCSLPPAGGVRLGMNPEAS